MRLLSPTSPQVISQSSSPLLPAAHAWPLQSLQGAQAFHLKPGVCGRWWVGITAAGQSH